MSWSSAIIRAIDVDKVKSWTLIFMSLGWTAAV
jgi:hypothetical protein